jgi:hypothetical protein
MLNSTTPMEFVLRTKKKHLKYAKKQTSKTSNEYGVYKLFKKVNPPPVTVEDVTEITE